MNFDVFHVLVGCVRSLRGGGSDSFIVWITRMHALGLFPTQIISHYKQKVREVIKESIMI